MNGLTRNNMCNTFTTCYALHAQYLNEKEKKFSFHFLSYFSPVFEEWCMRKVHIYANLVFHENSVKFAQLISAKPRLASPSWPFTNKTSKVKWHFYKVRGFLEKKDRREGRVHTDCNINSPRTLKAIKTTNMRNMKRGENAMMLCAITLYWTALVILWDKLISWPPLPLCVVYSKA